MNRIEVWDHLSENPYWCHQTTNETTWSVPPDVKPSGWRPSKDPVVHANMEQKYYDEMGIINPNKIVPRINKEDRILDEENGWYEGKVSIYYTIIKIYFFHLTSNFLMSIFFFYLKVISITMHLVDIIY